MLEIIGGLVLGVLVIIASLVFDAWVIRNLYDWFVVTAFAAPHLTLAQIAGVLLVFRSARGFKSSPTDPEDAKLSPSARITKVFGQIFGQWLVYLIVLLVGFVIKQLLPMLPEIQ